MSARPVLTTVLTGASAIALLGAYSAAALAAEPEKVWEASGFEAPESALYDAERGVIYVSNVAGEPNAKDGRGFISTLSPEGEVQEMEWATGMNAPKGLGLVDDTLYVADIDTVLAISTADGKVQDSWTVEGAKFLNDVAAAADGRVFVTDMLAGSIHVIEGGEISTFAEGEGIDNPNGVLATEDGLVVASWGVMTGEGFSTDPAGHLKMVSYDDQSVSSIGSGEPVGNLDGVEPDGEGGYYVTDWVNGALFHFDAEGNHQQLLDLNQGSADIGVIPDQNLVLVPMMMDGTVVAYRVE